MSDPLDLKKHIREVNDFPIPEITIFPLQLIIKSIHLQKFKSNLLAEPKIALPSASNTLLASKILSLSIIYKTKNLIM